MRKVSMKRKSGRKSAKQDENGVSDNQNTNSEASVNETENGDFGDTEDSEPQKKRRSGSTTNKRKSVSFSSKKEDNDEEEESQYEVESVLGEKIIRGVRYYLIRWKGYEPESDTWEPEKTLNCSELIKEFHANHKNENEKESKKKKKSLNKTNETHDETEEFEVDRILEVHHKRDGKREFLVSWKGYPASENSWEPEENMTCPELIAKFMKRVEKAKDSEQRELREKRTHTARFTLSFNDKGRRLSKRNQGKQRVQYHDAE